MSDYGDEELAQEAVEEAYSSTFVCTYTEVARAPNDAGHAMTAGSNASLAVSGPWRARLDPESVANAI